MSSPNDEYSKQEETIEQEISHLELNITTNYFNIQNIQDELDEVLESLEQNDDRKIDVTKIPDEFVNNIIDYMNDDTPVNQRILVPHHTILLPHNILQKPPKTLILLYRLALLRSQTNHHMALI